MGNYASVNFKDICIRLIKAIRGDKKFYTEMDRLLELKFPRDYWPPYYNLDLHELVLDIIGFPPNSRNCKKGDLPCEDCFCRDAYVEVVDWDDPELDSAEKIYDKLVEYKTQIDQEIKEKGPVCR